MQAERCKQRRYTSRVGVQAIGASRGEAEAEMCASREI
jgi:hypothetical protein